MDTFWPDIDLDLTEAQLHRLDLINCHIRSAQFDGAQFFEHTEFIEAQFSGHTIGRPLGSAAARPDRLVPSTYGSRHRRSPFAVKRTNRTSGRNARRTHTDSWSTPLKHRAKLRIGSSSSVGGLDARKGGGSESPAGNVPERHGRHRGPRKLQPMALTAEQTIKALVAVGLLAALAAVLLRGCRK